MQLASINTKLVIDVALDILGRQPGVRSSEVAKDPRVQTEHSAQVQEDAGTFNVLIGKTLSRAPEVVRQDKAPHANRDMLWIRA